jgi:hypothetical protein
MTKQPKQCAHANTVQSGDEYEIRTFCTDCNEVVSVQEVIVNRNSESQNRVANLNRVLKGNYTNAEFMDRLYKNHKR